jgi:hypothetical protein
VAGQTRSVVGGDAANARATGAAGEVIAANAVINREMHEVDHQ